MRYYESLERRLGNVKKSFHSFFQKNNDFTRGKVIRIRDANPDAKLVRGFCEGRESDCKDRMAMGIMFHGTHRDSIQSICNDGICEMSHFTNSFHYAVQRSQGKQNYQGDAQVLAMAVLVEEEDRLGWKDAKLRSPCRDHALPLFVLTIRNN